MVKKVDLPPAHAGSTIIIPNIRACLVAGHGAVAARYFCTIFAGMSPTVFNTALCNTFEMLVAGGMEGLLTNEALLAWLSSTRSLAEQQYWLHDIGTKPPGVMPH